MREAGGDDARSLEPWKVQCRERAKAQPPGRLRLACLPAASSENLWLPGSIVHSYSDGVLLAKLTVPMHFSQSCSLLS